MSAKALEDFYDKLRADESLEAEATAALQQGAEALIALGTREGFSFSADDLAAGLDTLSGGQELSEQDLDLVAGGSRPNCSEHPKNPDPDNFNRNGM